MDGEKKVHFDHLYIICSIEVWLKPIVKSQRQCKIGNLFYGTDFMAWSCGGALFDAIKNYMII